MLNIIKQGDSSSKMLADTLRKNYICCNVQKNKFMETNLMSQLRTELKPLYARLMTNVSEFNYDITAFCVQLGSTYPSV